VVVKVSPEFRAETPTPSSAFPSEDFTVPDKLAAAGVACAKISCATPQIPIVSMAKTKTERVFFLDTGASSDPRTI
jgi:hypothetical protein